jgi:hypothetical protein
MLGNARTVEHAEWGSLVLGAQNKCSFGSSKLPNAAQFLRAISAIAHAASQGLGR